MSTAICGDGDGQGEADGRGSRNPPASLSLSVASSPPLSGRKRKLSVCDGSEEDARGVASKDGLGLLGQAIEESIAHLQRVAMLAANMTKENATASDIEWCRQFLLESSAADMSVQSLTTELISAGHKTSRMAYLKTLAEAFARPKFEDGALEREWDQMCSERDGVKDGDAPPSYEKVQEDYKKSIRERIEAGWEKAHAINYCLLSSLHARGPMARALSKEAAQERGCYAHSAYALMDSLQSRILAPFPESCPEDAERGEDHPGRYYRNLTGIGSLVDDDPQWKKIEVPDETGFSGLTTHAILRPSRVLFQFDSQGWKSQVKSNIYELSPGDDVVAFDNLPKDDHGFHHGISVSTAGSEVGTYVCATHTHTYTHTRIHTHIHKHPQVGTSVAYPPYTLVRLKKVYKAGDWSAPVVCLSKWKNVGSTKPRKGREITHSKLAQKLDTKRTFGLPGHFTDAELEEAIGWRKNKKWGGYEECGPEALKVGPSRTALHQDDYIFVDPFYWQPDVEEIRPNCRLLLVRATFKFPACPQSAGKKATHKLCDEFASLTYGSRQTYIDGLNDILHKPILTMQQEWQREWCWIDREGVKYKSTEEWAYVTGPAFPKDCTPGRRDAANNGKTPQDFMQEVNDEIRRHWLEEKKTQVVPAFALVTLDEVLSVRLYTGPGHQPINDFLRQIAKLSGRLRLSLAKNVSDTFAATVANICHAIRKLLAITPPSQMGTPLYRGVRGELPTTFWVQDEQHMVCAVEGGFMSTSKNKETPIKYMAEGHHNILWKIEAKDESDVAFHRGADVSRLSQFAAEEEVLFPPCTILQVVKLPDATSEAGGKGEAIPRVRGAPTLRKYLDIVESSRFDSEKEKVLSELLQKETDNRVLQVFAQKGGHWTGHGEAKKYSFVKTPEWSEVSASLRAAEMQFAVMEAASRLFRRADEDKNETLDRGELESVIRDLARANGHTLSDANVTNVADRCIENFGNGTTVDEAGFLKYVDSMPAMFGKLDLWMGVFSHYASSGNNGVEMSKEDAYRLVCDILNSNDENCEAENVNMYAKELFQTADSDNSGSISFPEFVKYATDRQSMFEKLPNAIGTPEVEPAAMGGAAQQDAGNSPSRALRSALSGRMAAMVSGVTMDEYTKFQMEKAKGLGLQVSFHQVSDSQEGGCGVASSVQKSYIQLDVEASFV